MTHTQTAGLREKESLEGAQAPMATVRNARTRGFAWRLEYTFLVVMALLFVAVGVALAYFSTEISQLKSYGYAGLFLVNVIGAASILFPSPAGASVVGGGALLDNFLGVPAFVWVGLVAGLGEAVGEVSGYAAGYGGRFIIEDKPQYHRIRRWMQRRGTLTMFLMSTIPNPLFDVAGLAAGATNMRIAHFFPAVLAGKIIKDTWLAAVGGLGAGIVGYLV